MEFCQSEKVGTLAMSGINLPLVILDSKHQYSGLGTHAFESTPGKPGNIMEL